MPSSIFLLFLNKLVITTFRHWVTSQGFRYLTFFVHCTFECMFEWKISNSVICNIAAEVEEMGNVSWKLVALVCILVILAQLYVMIAQVIGSFQPAEMLRPITLTGSGRHNSGNTFSMGSKLKIIEESDLATTYVATIYDSNSSIVYERKGRFVNSSAEENVDLQSPTFSVGSYRIIFAGFSYDVPILGVQFSDTTSIMFELTEAATTLTVNVSFDSSSRVFEGRSNLTSLDSDPIIGETVEFSIRLASRNSLTDGWLPLGSAATDEQGVATLVTGLIMPDDNYSVMAFHIANSNFGESSAFTEIEIVDGGYSEGKYGMTRLSSVPAGLLLTSGEGIWSITQGDNSTYVTLPTKLMTSFTIDYELEGCFVEILYFLDDFQHRLSNFTATERYGDHPWTYESTATWTPSDTGSHTLIVGIGNGSDIFQCENWSRGIGLFSEAQYTLNVTKCPSVLLVQPSQAIGDATLPVTVGFFKPRLYKSGSDGFFAGSRIASALVYNQLDCTLDDPIPGKTVVFLVNGTTYPPYNSTDENGLVVFRFMMTSADRYDCLNITATTYGNEMPYEDRSTSQVINFTKVSVQDTGGNYSSDFVFNYTVYNCNQQTDAIYVGDEPNTVRATVNLFSIPVQSAAVNFSAEQVIGYGTVSSGAPTIPVPAGADLLRIKNFTTDGTLKPFHRIKASYGNGQSSFVDAAQGFAAIPASACNVTLLVNPPIGDINQDSKVDIFDAILLANVFGIDSTNPNWNSTRDLKENNIVDIFDCIILANHFGEDNRTAFLTLGTIEFLKTTSLNALARTDNSGVSSVNWYSAEAGTYLVKATISSGFNVTVNYHSLVIEINASLSTIRYVSVIKRTVNLEIVSPAGANVATLAAVADTYIYEGNAGQNYGSQPHLLVGDDFRNNWYQTLILFNISAIPSNAYIISSRLNLFGTYATEVGAVLGVHRVLQPWNEDSVNWSSRPSFDLAGSCYLDLPEGWSDKWLFLNVTADVRYWQQNSTGNYGLLLMLTEARSLVTLNSRETAVNSPYLEVSYVTSGPEFVVAAYDNVTNKPINHLHITCNIDFSFYGPWPFGGSTNESGCYSYRRFYPPNVAPCNVTVSSDENSTYHSGYLYTSLDFRFPTNITFDQSIGNPRVVNTGISYTYQIWVASSSKFGIEGATVTFRINGTSVDGIIKNDCLSNSTICNGNVSFVWAAPANGTYLVNATFEGSDLYKPCQTYLIVKVKSTPLAVVFSVTPQEFVTGSSLSLQATILDPLTNTTFTETSVTVEFLMFNGSDGTHQTLCTKPTVGGVATTSIPYPNDNQHAHAYMARIVPAVGQIHQGIVSNPVQLTASKPSRILLDVTRDWSSQNHTVEGWLLSGTSGISNRRVKITVNQNDYWSSTNLSGYFCLSLNLPPVNNNASTYTISASFEDNVTQPLSATAWAKTLDGQDYAACTTVQYGYKPAYNTTTLTISAQSTEMMTTTMSPAEMQQEAEQSGALTIWHEWSWTYPWYRLHVKVHVNPTIHVGFNPILLGGEIAEWNDLNFFNGLRDEVLQTVGIEAFGLVATYLLAKYLSIGSFTAGILTELVKIGFQVGFLFPGWNSAEGMLASAVMSAVMLLFALTNFASTVSNFLVRIIDELAWLCKGAVSALTWVLAKLKDMFLWGRGAYSAVVDVMEVVADATLLVLALRRSNELLHGV